jgi:hypothetical protein
MTPDDAYLADPGLAKARHLQRAGQWGAALELIDGNASELRAEILVERHVFRLDPVDEAVEAVDAIAGTALATLLKAQLEYWRQLLTLGGEPIMDDPVAGFARAAQDARLAGWATFHGAIATENLHDDGVNSAAGYQKAARFARDTGDVFLESYVVRHQGDQAINREGDRERGIALLRRSLQLRAALGARPQVAAAQIALAGELPAGPEADELREIGRRTARELGIPWLSE